MNPAKFMEKFEALKNIDKAVLKAIAVVGGDLNKTKIAQIMLKFGKTPEEKNLITPARITPISDRLINALLINDSFFIKQDIADFIVKNCISDNDARELAMAATRDGDIEYYIKYESKYPSASAANKLSRHLRLTVLSGDQEEYFRIKKTVEETGLSLSILTSLCLNPFRQEWMEKMPAAMSADIIEGIISCIFIDAGKIPDDVRKYFLAKYVITEQDSPKLSRRIYLLAMDHLYSHGEIDISELEEYGLSRLNDYYGLYGLDMLISGKKEESIQYWKDNISLAKKATRKKNWMIPGLCGQIYLFMTLAGHISEDDKTMKAWFNFVLNNSELGPEALKPREFLYNAWLVKSLTTDKETFKDINSYELHNVKKLSALSFLFLALSFSIVFEELPDYIAPPCLEAHSKIKKQGSPWLKSELANILEKLNIDDSKKPDIRDIKPFISSLITTREKWQSTLETIKKMLTISEDKKLSSEKRLIWIVDLAEGNIYPMEQKLSAKGIWSSGKKASIKRLKKEKDNFLTDQDARAIDASEMAYDYYRGYELDLKIEKAISILEGHPFVFEKNKDNSLVRVEICKGKPGLSVKKGKNEINVSISPFPEEYKIILVKEPPARIRIYNFSDELIKIAKVIGKDGLSAPVEAEEKIREILAPASPYLEIQSDLTAIGLHMDTIESDSMPSILLYPVGTGIRADITVLPLGDSGPSFKPGQGGEIIMTELEGKKVQSIRNLKNEKAKAKKVIENCPSLEQASKSFHWYSEDIEDILELVSELKEVAEKGLAAVAWPEGKSLGIRANVDTDKMNIKVSSGVDWFEIDGSVKTDDGTIIDIKKIMSQLSTDSRFVKIGENEFLALSKSLHKKLLAIESASEQTKSGLKVGKGAAVMLREILSDMKGAKTDKLWKDYQKRIDEALSLEPKIPSTLQAELRPYQAEGYTWLCRLAAIGTGACLADDMGLGKTVQTLALLLRMASKGPSLVVAPTSVCGNWVAETSKFAPTLNPIIFGGSDREQMLKDLGPMDILIVSYGLIQQEEKLFEEIKWNVIVLDEAQAIKNETAKRTQTVLKLMAEFRLITTGTPVENSLDELYTLFSFINPGLLGSRSNFNEKYSTPIEREKNKAAQARLKHLIRPFMLRRLRTDVLDDLPEKTEIVIKVEADKIQAAFYESLRRDIVEDLEQDEEKPAGQKYLQILAGITKLRLASCHPELAAPGCGIEGAKTDTLMELVEELLENRHKALIFSQFTSFLSIVRKALDNKGIKYLYLDGSTPAKQRNASVASFQAGETDFFLISLKAGGTGLNLTAANYVIHLDPWWNPAVEDQASARAHRMGQKQPVTIYRLVMSGSIEEKIMALHKYKRNLADSILEGAEATGKMSATELMNLIKSV